MKLVLKHNMDQAGLAMDTAAKELSPNMAKALVTTAEKVIRPSIVKAVRAWTSTTTTRKTGALMRSFRTRFLERGGTIQSVGVLSDLPYAGIHETGGRITPKGGKYLTVPLQEFPVGTRASDFPNAFFIRSKAGNLILAERRGENLNPLFVLKESVQIRPKKYLSKAAKEAGKTMADVYAKELAKGIQESFNKHSERVRG